MAKKSQQDIRKEIRSLDEEARKQQKTDDLRFYVEPNDGNTRQKIARQFVLAYFGLLTILIVGIPIYNLISYRVAGPKSGLEISLTDIIQTYSAIVGPTLGFVIAYYFKTRNDK